MVLDIIIVIIVLLFAIYGFKKGFIFSLIHTVGWAIALVGAYFGVSAAAGFIREHTTFYDWILEGYTERFTGGDVTVSDGVGNLPATLSSLFDDAVDTAQEAVARSFAELTYQLIIFAALFILIKLVMWLILRIFSKDYRDGFTGFFDGFFGMIFGILKAGVLVFLLLALFIPVTELLAPDLAAAFTEQLEYSWFAKDLYDNNLLIILAEKFFGNIF